MLNIMVENWISLGNGLYVWHDGTIRRGAVEGNQDDMYNKGWWNSKKEAERFLREWLPQSPWLDREAVRLAAGRGEREALLSSITHWRQIIVNWDIYFRDKQRGKVTCDATYCALCQRFIGNTGCPLQGGEYCSGCCADEWKDFNSNATLANAIAMHNKLVTIRNQKKELEPIKTKIEEPKKAELKPGDVVGGFYGQRLIVKIAGKLYAVDEDGQFCASGQSAFDTLGYTKIGTCSSFGVKIPK